MILSVCNSGLSFSICDQLASKKQSSKGQARVSICRKGDDGLAGCPPWPDKVLVVWLGQPPWTKHDQRQSQSQSNQISKQSESESESKSKSFQSRLLDSTTTTTTSKQPAESRIGNHSIILKFWLRFWLGNLKSCRNPHHLPRSCLRVFCWARNESESAVCTWVIKIATAHPHTDTHTHTHTSLHETIWRKHFRFKSESAWLCCWLDWLTQSHTSTSMLLLAGSAEFSDVDALVDNADSNGLRIRWNNARPRAHWHTCATPVHLLWDGLAGLYPRKTWLTRALTWSANALRSLSSVVTSSWAFANVAGSK